MDKRSWLFLEIAMVHSWLLRGIFISGLIVAVLAPPIQARAFEISGVWSTDAELCSRVFSRKDNQVEFAELSDLYGSGFIIDGNRIKGKAAHCKIESRNQDGDTLKIFAACATSIMNQNAEFHLKIVDDDNVVRSFPDIPGMTVKYSRCKI
jgi:hypothetical protein